MEKLYIVEKIVKKYRQCEKNVDSGKKWTVEIIDRGKKNRDSGKENIVKKNRDGRKNYTGKNRQ